MALKILIWPYFWCHLALNVQAELPTLLLECKWKRREKGWDGLAHLVSMAKSFEQGGHMGRVATLNFLKTRRREVKMPEIRNPKPEIWGKF